MGKVKGTGDKMKFNIEINYILEINTNTKGRGKKVLQNLHGTIFNLQSQTKYLE